MTFDEPIRAVIAPGVDFSPMPPRDELLKRALARTDRELERELVKAIAEMRERLTEGGTPDQIEAREQQIAAAERALARIRKRLKR